MRKLLIVVIAAFLSAAAARSAPTDRLAAHEWGTFTSLQDDDGTAIGAINADDEPVPGFVCEAGRVGISRTPWQLTPTLEGGKGLTACHPGVTMRLETPVIYFYPPPHVGSAPAIDVHVSFRGGWLTEFYPRAEVSAPDLLESSQIYPTLTPVTVGSLAWNGLELDVTGPLTATNDPIWTAPREVARAAVVHAPPVQGKPEGADNRPEKFLFYRGLGHLDSPLRIVHDPVKGQLEILADPGAFAHTKARADAASFRVPAAWLIEIRAEDGACAFRPLPEMSLANWDGQPLAALPASFSPGDFGPTRLAELRASMQQALLAAGLFADEAAAMLKTWELSYFKSPGLRLFYVAPRGWVNEVLPLSIGGADVTRAMIGRIELITPRQRELLARIAAGPCPNIAAFSQARWAKLNDPAAAAKFRTSPPGVPWSPPSLAELKVPVPALYQDYLDLGRFRDALLLRAQSQQPTEALAEFITANGLRAHNSAPFFLSSLLPGDEHSR